MGDVWDKICRENKGKHINFDLLPTVHLSIFISVINQLDRASQYIYLSN